MTAPVRRRCVFFLSGFDPKGASYYHALYRREAMAQQNAGGSPYTVGDRTRLPDGDSMWTVQSRGDAGDVVTQFEYVRWDDIVRRHWPRTAWGVIVAAMRAYAMALTVPGALLQVARAAPKRMVALALPALVWGALFVVAATLGALLGGWPGAGIALLVAMWTGGRIERRFNSTWLLRIYAFSTRWARGAVPELDVRLTLLARRIEARLRDPAIDEVLLVGYSVGAMLAVSAAARIDVFRTGGRFRHFSLLTLGHAVPLLAFDPAARWFRDELGRLGDAPHRHWVDYSSPTDWGSFALLDPIAMCLQSAPRAHAPVMRSPRFHTMFSAERYARLARDKRRMHLQYLMAGDRPADYDYFAITAGPQRLRDRVDARSAP